MKKTTDSSIEAKPASDAKSKKKTNPFSYAFGMFGTSIPINMFKTYAAKFYVDNLSATTFSKFAGITFFYTFVDAVDNPIYGFLSDRTRTPYGRRRPWLVVGAPLLVLAFILFFNPSGSVLSSSNVFWYIAILYVLTGTLDSLISSNYSALFPELFKTEHERAKTNTIKQIFQLLAMVLSVAVTPTIADAIGYGNTSIAFGAMALAVILWMAFGAHEDMSSMDRPKPQLLSSIIAVITNPKFWKYGVANATYAAALCLIQAGVTFYVKYFMGIENGLTATIILGVAIIGAIMFMPVWFKIIKKHSVLPPWRAAFGITAVGILPLYFTKSLAPAIAVVLLVGFGMAGIQASMDLVAAKILDEDARKYGLKREGIYSSLLGVLNKTNGLFVSAGYVIVDKLYGFESGDVPGSNPSGASAFITVLFPAALLLLGFIFSFFVKFDETDAPESPAGDAEQNFEALNTAGADAHGENANDAVDTD